MSARKLPSLGSLFFATVCCGVFALSSSTAWSAPAPAAVSTGSLNASPATPRIVAPVDENRLTTLKGNTRPEARPEFDRGSVAPGLPMGDLFLVLRRGPEQQAAFDAFLASQQDPSSSDYHHWLTPDEIGQRFGPAQGDIDTISHWLQNYGFTVSNISRDRMFIRFDGMAGQVGGAFHTEIHNLNVRGESHIANMSDPQIPEALTPVVVGVKALHNFFPHTLHKMGGAVRHKADGGWERIADPEVKPVKVKPVKTADPAPNAKKVRPLFGTGGTPATIEDVSPYDLAAIYNILPLWNASTPIDGAGQTIAIAGRSNITLSDIATFRSAFDLPPNVPKVIVTNTDPGACPGFASNCQGDLIENTLDVEWAGAVAKKAQIILVTSSGTTATSDGSFLSEQYIVDNVTAKIMNVSYGECEFFLTATNNASYNTLWSSAQMAGIAVFVATGDSGSATCDAGQATSVPYGAQFGLSVSGVASTPYDTAVGGTDFAWGWLTNGQATYWGTSDNGTTNANALGYIPEFPWNSTCSNFELDNLFNSQLGDSLNAGEMCDEIGRKIITPQNAADEPSFLALVDTVGAGGGASSCVNGDGASLASCSKGYPKPSWQAGVTGIPNDNVRDIPDISMFSANGFSGSAYVICVAAAGSCSYTQGTEPAGEEVGGTSVAAPIMAGVMALINQKAGSTQGNPNAELYKIAALESYGSCSSENIPLTGSSCVFNDIDTGSIAMPCDVGSPDCAVTDETLYSVLSGSAGTTGYDLASGLGSVNVTNLVNAFASLATGPVVTLTPASIAFPNTHVGATSPAQTITLKNTGTAILSITGITVTGTNAGSFSQANTCGTSVAIGASCTITVTFSPTTFGSDTATVGVADNAAASPQTVALTGTATEEGTYTLTAAAVTVAPGSSGTSSVTATGTGGYSTPNTITISSCTLATSPSGATDLPGCTIGAATITFASGATTGSGGSLTISTTGATASVKMGQLKGAYKTWPVVGGGVALAGLLLFGIPARRRRWKSLLGLIVFLAMLGSLSACGGGGGGGGGGTSNPGTTAGTYTFTVTGQDADGVKQTVTLTVTVS